MIVLLLTLARARASPVSYGGSDVSTILLRNSSYKSTRFNFVDEGEVFLHFCTFQSCYSSESGGAIYFFHSLGLSSTFLSFGCAFLNCSAHRYGALCITATHSSIMKSCFTSCAAEKNTNAVYIHSSGVNLTRINDSTVIKSGVDSEQLVDFSLLFDNCRVILSHVNSSFNQFGGHGLSIALSNCNEVQVNFGLFSNNSGISLLFFRNSDNISIVHCNAIGQKLRAGILAFYGNFSVNSFSVSHLTLLSNQKADGKVVNDSETMSEPSLRISIVGYDCEIDDISLACIGKNVSADFINTISSDNFSYNPGNRYVNDLCVEVYSSAEQEQISTAGKSVAIALICVVGSCIVAGTSIPLLILRRRRAEYRVWVDESTGGAATNSNQI